jgi:MtN3 and saliva related transmembrane protein
MDILANALGGLAAFLTTIANVPQVIKCFRTGRAGDLSKKMLIALAMGFALWLVYGLIRGDPIIVAANAVSLGLVAVLLWFKWCEARTASAGPADVSR